MSNAVQTIAAANNGITSITKLVESAQATARQALQTAATVDQQSGSVPVSLATSASSNTTSLTITADVAVSLATPATSDTTSLTIVADVTQSLAVNTSSDTTSLTIVADVVEFACGSTDF